MWVDIKEGNDAPVLAFLEKAKSRKYEPPVTQDDTIIDGATEDSHVPQVLGRPER